MLFNSFNFFVFFLSFILIWSVFPSSKKWISLLLGSLYFYYTASGALIVIPLLITIIVYAGAFAIKKYGFNLFLTATVVVLSFLIYYKYIGAFSSLFHDFKFNTLLVPLGISYFTFQAVGYLIEIKNKKIEPEKNIFKLCLYLIYFPKIIAGPIEKPSNFLNQINKPTSYNFHNTTQGIKLIIVGLFKKVVVADRLNLIIAPVFANVAENQGMPILISCLLFPVQLYMDFSGYTDMARGFSKIMGIELTENFNKPFNSTTLTEFWRRWHISLSTWFNEHVFNSLSFYTRNLGQLGLFLSVTITFSIIGVWHGATLGFLVFGVLNGIAISIEMLTKKMRKKIAKKIAPTFLSIIGHTYLFLLVAFLFVFVKTASLSGFVLVAQSVLNIHMIQDTVLVFNHFIHHVPFSPNKLNSFTFIGNLLRDYNVVIVCAAGTLITLFNFIKQNGYKYFSLINYFRYTVLVVLIMQFGVYHNAAEFVYFKF